MLSAWPSNLYILHDIFLIDSRNDYIHPYSPMFILLYVQLYPVKKILIQMGRSKRPGMIAIKKSINSQQPAELPWVYRVSTERECRTFFRVPPSSVPSRLDGPICDVYTDPEGFPDYGSLVSVYHWIVACSILLSKCLGSKPSVWCSLPCTVQLFCITCYCYSSE